MPSSDEWDWIEPSPGPWRLDGDLIRDRDGNVIASILHLTGEGQAQANGRILAAGWDLLAALKELNLVAATVLWHAGPDPAARQMGLTPELLARVRAAIDQATLGRPAED